MRWPYEMERMKNESDIKPVSDRFTGFICGVDGCTRQAIEYVWERREFIWIYRENLRNG